MIGLVLANHEIGITIIRPNLIHMMDLNSERQRITERFFSNEKMF